MSTLLKAAIGAFADPAGAVIDVINVVRSLPESPGYVPGLSELVYNNITPLGYRGHDGQIMNVVRGVVRGGDVGPEPAPDRIPRGLFNLVQDPKPREDAWRTYLGLEQANNTFSDASYTPSRASDENAKYLKINSFWDRLGYNRAAGNNPFRPGPLRSGSHHKVIEDIVSRIETNEKVNGEAKLPVEDVFAGVMGNFSFSKGEDEHGPYIAYYDKWDLDKAFAKLVGREFEIYDRLYYDPRTFMPLTEQPTPKGDDS